jgi:hypothetical protein
MSGGTPATLQVGLVAFAIALGVARVAAAQGDPPYSRMAPLEQYLMPDRDAEVALARTAAPRAISDDATVLVLGRRGYERAAEGRNGFLCLVGRAWGSPFDGPNSGFWTPKNRSPVCYNPAGARSILPVYYLRTRLALAGLSKEQILDSVRAAFAAHALPSPEPGAMAYMMSKRQRIGPQAVQWVPHLMFELPKAADVDWGANAAGSPILLHQDSLDPISTEFLVPVGRWSDGSPAPSH